MHLEQAFLCFDRMTAVNEWRFKLGVKCEGTKLTGKIITVLILHKQAFWKSLIVQGNNVSD